MLLDTKLCFDFCYLCFLVCSILLHILVILIQKFNQHRNAYSQKLHPIKDENAPNLPISHVFKANWAVLNELFSAFFCQITDPCEKFQVFVILILSQFLRNRTLPTFDLTHGASFHPVNLVGQMFREVKFIYNCERKNNELQRHFRQEMVFF